MMFHGGARRAAGCGLALTLLLAAFGTQAQSATAYPARPLRFIVPYAAGGNGDIVARILAQKLVVQMGQQIVIDNRGGAGGNIGAELAARAAPDGYTLMLGTNTHAINMSLFAKLPYDLQRDFAPVTRTTSAPMVLIVHPSLPVKTVKEFIALAKAQPGKLNFATGGSGSSAHVITELFASMAGVQLTHVTYKGVAQATTDLIAGQIQMSFNSTSTALAHMQAGRVRGLGISTATRSSAAPGVPTIAESGLPGFDASIWQGIFVPARTAPEIVARLNREIVAALNANDIKDQLGVQGLDALPSTPEQFATFIKAEIAKWAQVIKVSGAKAE